MGPIEWISLAGVLVVIIGGAYKAHHTLDIKLSARVGTLHEKVEEVKRDYVRRDDLRDDINSLRSEIQRMEKGQDSLGSKMDGISNAMVPAMARLTEAAIAMRDK